MPRRRRPPLMPDKWRRTQLISLMVAPEASSARASACLSSSVEPGRRQRQQRRAAARNEAQHEIVRAQVPHAARACARRARMPAASGTGCAASTISMRSQGTAVAVAGHDHEPGERTRPMPLHGLRHGRRGLARRRPRSAGRAAPPAGAAACTPRAAPTRSPPRTWPAAPPAAVPVATMAALTAKRLQTVSQSS